MLKTLTGTEYNNVALILSKALSVSAYIYVKSIVYLYIWYSPLKDF